MPAQPAVRIEVAVGRRRTWYGQRLPAVTRWFDFPPRSTSDAIRGLVALLRRTPASRGAGRRVPVTIHRTSEPGSWVVAYPWQQRDQAELIARAAFRLAETPSERLFARAVEQARAADGPPPEWITDEARAISGRRGRGRVPLISISTNGRRPRAVSHIARLAPARRRTTDSVLIGGTSSSQAAAGQGARAA
jgi:hypothetical protein